GPFPVLRGDVPPSEVSGRRSLREELRMKSLHSDRFGRRVLAIALCIGLAGVASAARYEIVPGDPNEVTFVSKAPLETFDGSTKQIRGRIEIDPQALGDSITVEVSVDLASLDTGIELRNQHMRENHLHTEKHPEAVFRGAHL